MKKLTNHLKNVDRKVIVILIATFFTSIFLGYSYIDFSANMSIGEGYSYTAKSLALSRNFNVNEYKGNAGVDVYIAGDNYYVAYPPFASFLMSLPYLGLQSGYYLYNRIVGPINGDLSILFESWAMGLVSSLSLVGIGLLFTKLVSKKNKSVFYFSLVMLLFGTLLFNYSVTYFNHVVSAFFVFSAYYLLVVKKVPFWAGVLTGMAFLTEHPTIVLAIAVGLYEVIRILQKKSNFGLSFKNLLSYGFGVLPFCFLMLLYNFYHHGNPFLFAESLLHNYKLNVVGMSVHSFSVNPIYGLFGLYFHPLKGLFLYSPFLLFSFVYLLKRRSSSRMLLGLIYVVLISFIYGMWSDCWGATAYGSRYLISTIPFWGLWAYEGVIMLNKKWQMLYYLLGIYSIGIALLNALLGIAWQKFDECEYIYGPIRRIRYNYFSGKPPIMKSALFEYIFKR